MCGVVLIRDPNATTTTTAPPTTTTTTAPAPTPTTGPSTTPTTVAAAPPAPATSAGTHAATAPPAPTTTTGKAEKDKKPKDETTTTSTAPPPAPVDLPDSAIIPALPGTSAGAVTAAPAAPPQGNAAAPLPEQQHHTKGVKLLILTGLGIAGLGVGTGVYKFANRSSKYFPA
jgi:hypothetical protein